MNIKPVKYTYGEHNVTWGPGTDHTAFYPKGSYKPSGKIIGGFGAEVEVRVSQFSYQVRFPSDFEWQKGGKLHGLSFGDGATGGAHPNTGGSVRLMWRRGGNADAYLYYPGSKEEYGESNIFGQFNMNWNKITIQWDEGTSELKVTVNNDTFSKKVDFKAPQKSVLYSTFFGGNDKSWATKKDQQIEFRNLEILSPSSQ